MKVLVIEDPRWSSKKELMNALRNHRKIIVTFYDSHNTPPPMDQLNVDVCVIDANQGWNRQFDTVAITKHIKKNFRGTIIAVSSIPYSRIPLLRAGCTYCCSKGNLPKILIHLASLLSAKKPPPRVLAGNIFSPIV